MWVVRTAAVEVTSLCSLKNVGEGWVRPDGTVRAKAPNIQGPEFIKTLRGEAEPVSS